MENQGTITVEPGSEIESYIKRGWKVFLNEPPHPAQDSSSSAAAAALAMDDEELGEGEIWDDGDEDLWDDGYIFGVEEGRLVVTGRVPKPGRKKLGPPPPDALTLEKLERKIAETGKTFFFLGDDPFVRSNWNPFPVAEYYSPPPTASDAGLLEEDLRLRLDLGNSLTNPPV